MIWCCITTKELTFYLHHKQLILCLVYLLNNCRFYYGLILPFNFCQTYPLIGVLFLNFLPCQPFRHKYLPPSYSYSLYSLTHRIMIKRFLTLCHICQLCRLVGGDARIDDFLNITVHHFL